MKQSRGSALLALTLLSVLSGCSAGADGENVSTSQGELRALEGEEASFLALINVYRAQNGLGALTATPLLNQVAYDHSLDMGQKGYFNHDDLLGSSPFERMRAAGYRGGAMSENIAAGNSSAQATFNQWKNSAGHNANMLGSPYRAIGIGRAAVPGSPYTYYWTTDFGDVIDGSQMPGGEAPDAGGADAGPQAPVAKVQLFEHSSYRGRTQSLGVGRYPLSQLGAVGNDSVSSMRVPSTLKVTLFQHDNFAGASRLFTRDASYLSGFNDQASSVVVEAR